jgi:hypothetical protein
MDVSVLLPFVNLLLFTAGASAIFRLSKRVHSSWLRIPIKATASILGVMAAGTLLMLLLFEASCTRHATPIKSPDGRYVAVIDYALQGALGDDYANVGIRRRFSPRAQNVYHGVGAWDFKKARPFDPEVRWLDSEHLLIRYRMGLPECRSQLDQVEIICQSAR